MSNGDLRERIQSTLKSVPNKNFLSVTKDLLNVLGYQSERTLELSGRPEDFIQKFPALNENTRTEQAFCENAQSVQLVFQLTSHEIASTGLGTNAFDEGQQQSFIFFSVVLKETNYARGQYAEFTREINKRINVPTVVFYRAGNMMTIAFVGRRPHKRDRTRDVLEQVTLIKDIRHQNPYRAHLDIIEELSLRNLLSWMESNNQPKNFDSLLEAWLNKLDTEELNRRFYRDLYNWFELAIAEATFPKNQAQTIPSEEHVIRLITRLLFVWFIKEKNLIADDLFIEHNVGSLLKNYDTDTGDSYYRAILQNLFFATLNTEIDKRRFSKQNRADHRNPSVYRYRKEIDDPDSLLNLFEQTPFINGGLFDCLDSFEGVKAGGSRIDCFTDNPAQRRDYSIPNRLFFGADGLVTLFNNYKFTVEENTPIEQEVALDPELLGKVFENLLAAYAPETHETARKQTGSFYTPRAVVDYMVDEVLMASLAEKCQPTDGDMAFWRERLRYLLDYEDAFDDANELFEDGEAESIVRAIADIKVLDPAVGSGAFPMGMLHKLTLALRRLDPKNKRWEALQKERAREKADAAFETRNQQERDAELLEISETFERYSGDFGRKLYLIQNSIFGVDILPVACQIAKLRFFISLAIEQEPDKNADNFGIKPLPNLETRFIIADTLIGLGLSEVRSLLQDDTVQQLLKEIEAIREKYFLANNRPQKLQYIHQEEACRDQLEQALKIQKEEWVARQQRDIDEKIARIPNPKDREKLRKDEGKKYSLREKRFDASLEDAQKVAQWKPYDQNSRTNWFDPEYMFGVADGFDIVIGNPPYVQLQKNGGELGRLYKDAGFATFVRTGDIYQLFYEKAINLLKQNIGHVCFISSNQWMRVDSGKVLRNFFESQNPIRLVNLGAGVFDNVTVNTCIMLVNRSPNKNILQAAQQFPPTEWVHISPMNGETWIVLSEVEQRIRKKIEMVGTPLKEWNITIHRGIVTGYNTAFIIDDTTRQALVVEDPNSAEIIKPILLGRDIQRYQASGADLWLIYIPWHFPLHLDSSIKGSSVEAEDLFREQYPAIYQYLLLHKSGLSSRNKSETGIRYEWYALQRWGANYYEEFAQEKIVWGNLANQAKFSYAPQNMFVSAPTTMLTPFSHYLLAVLNSKLVDWYFRLIGVERAGGYYEYKPMFIERLPIPKISADKHDIIATIVDYIIYLKKQPSTDGKNLAHARDYMMVKYFEQIIDGLVYELYLTDELHRADKYFFKTLLDEHLPPIKEISGDKMSLLRNTFEHLFDRKHPVRKNLFFLDSLETIRIIEGKA